MLIHLSKVTQLVSLLEPACQPRSGSIAHVLATVICLPQQFMHNVPVSVPSVIVQYYQDPNFRGKVFDWWVSHCSALKSP